MYIIYIYIYTHIIGGPGAKGRRQEEEDRKKG